MKGDVIHGVKLFPTVYRRIYCCKFLTLSNQKSRYKSKCIRIDSMSYRLGLLKLSSLKNQVSYTSKAVHFGKAYFDPLQSSLGLGGCIYDNKNIKRNCLIRNCSAFKNQALFIYQSSSYVHCKVTFGIRYIFLHRCLFV